MLNNKYTSEGGILKQLKDYEKHVICTLTKEEWKLLCKFLNIKQ